MNTYQLAALQLMLLQSIKVPAKWIASVSKPTRYTEPDIAFHKGTALAKDNTNYATNATDSSYTWNLSNIQERFCAAIP